ncbi:MAG TPA: DUF1761 domain-containing protein [Hyphomicrobiales bacterium]|nr:DUF1761 domain-containing protein [Kaistiaceae bacterium]HQF30518.1 DUF1761 domain-containing protein [Hyphomicrobiales bacterium]
MVHAGTNYLAVLVAAIVGFGVGAVWYGILGKQWMKVVGLDEDPARRRDPMPFVIAGVADLVMAFVLAGAIGHLGPGQVTVFNGVVSAAILWTGMVATTVAVNNAFAQRPWRLTVIDAGHWLAVLVAMGIVIGVFGE